MLEIKITISKQKDPDLVLLYEELGKNSFTALVKTCIKAPFDPVAKATVVTIAKEVTSFNQTPKRCFDGPQSIRIETTLSKSDGAVYDALKKVSIKSVSCYAKTALRTFLGLNFTMARLGLPVIYDIVSNTAVMPAIQTPMIQYITPPIVQVPDIPKEIKIEPQSQEIISMKIEEQKIEQKEERKELIASEVTSINPVSSKSEPEPEPEPEPNDILSQLEAMM